MLDRLRNTNVQKKEVGGITQQLSTSWISIENILDIILRINTKKKYDITIPGLLFIDTPGHETFMNMRSKGTSICNLVILIINITKGIQEQTLECIKLLKSQNIPYVIVLNKIDKIYKWVNTCTENNGESFVASIKKQPTNVSSEFTNLLNNMIYELGKQDIDSKLYYEIKNLNESVPIVPISAVTGTGIPDLMLLITQYVQKKLRNQIMYNDGFDGSVMEVVKLEGYGNVINVLVINGCIKKGDNIMMNSTKGPISKTVRFVLTKNTNSTNNDLIHNDIVRATNYISIVTTNTDDIEKVITGSSLYVIVNDDGNVVRNKLLDDYNILNSYLNENDGIVVASSTMGSLESILILLKKNNILVNNFIIGSITKTDIMKVTKKKIILVFDIDVSKEVELEAEHVGINIIKDNIVYNLINKLIKHLDDELENNKIKKKNKIVWPCVLQILPQYVFNTKDPIIVGVKVLGGEIHKKTKICVPSKGGIIIGKISKIQHNNKDVDIAKINEDVAISLIPVEDKKYVYKRHFDETDILYSKITRESIDLMKQLFKQYVVDNIKLFTDIKKILDIK